MTKSNKSTAKVTSKRAGERIISIEVEIMGQMSFGLYANWGDTLLQLDLATLNLRLISVYSQACKDYIKSLTPNEHEFDFLMKEIEETKLAGLVIAVPINPAFYKKEVFKQLETSILIRCPSYIALLKTIVLQSVTIGEKTYYRSAMMHYPARQVELREMTLEVTSVELASIQAFVPIYFGRLERIKWLTLTIDSYVNSFDHALRKDYLFSYIGLFICLESLVKGGGELTYRIRRLCASLNSDTPEQGAIIFRNVKQLYELRSRIVHGDKINKAFLDGYWSYSMELISSTLVLLIHSNFKSIPDLNNKITQSGFGHKQELIGLNEATSLTLLNRLEEYTEK